MQLKKMEAGLMDAEEGQSDCYWHDHSASIRYLLVLHGVARDVSTDHPLSEFVHSAGAVNRVSPIYKYLCLTSPSLLPHKDGPLSVFLIL